MTAVTIRQTGRLPLGFKVEVILPDGTAFERELVDPFSVEDENLMAWYLETYPRFPLVDTVRAKKAASAITRYGHELFHQLFGAEGCLQAFRVVAREYGEDLEIRIEGSRDFQALHWEALKAPDDPVPLSLRSHMLRRVGSALAAVPDPRSKDVLHILVVVARPDGDHDVDYRTITRPLVEAVGGHVGSIVVDVVRPGTRQALVHYLSSKPEGYDIVHFDVHGALLTPAELRVGYLTGQFQGTDILIPDREDAPQPYLMLETGRDGSAEPVAAHKIARLLVTHRIGTVILNACQSDRLSAEVEGSLATILFAAGIACVVAMRYSVSVSAVELMMPRFYEGLLAGQTVSAALRCARRTLYDRQVREGPFGTFELQDWTIPVLYCQRDLALSPKPPYLDSTPQRRSEPALPGGSLGPLVGRDRDILRIERQVISAANPDGATVIVVYGMQGIGKSALLQHLAAWWLRTNLVGSAVCLDLEEHDWTMESLRQAIAVPPEEPEISSQPGLAAAVNRTDAPTGRLRRLLVIDHLDQVLTERTGNKESRPASPTTEELEDFIASCQASGWLILIGTRGNARWLDKSYFRYELPALDDVGAAELSGTILKTLDRLEHANSREVSRLIRLAAGIPAAMIVFLEQLRESSPAIALQRIRPPLGTGSDMDRTTAPLDSPLLSRARRVSSQLTPQSVHTLSHFCLINRGFFVKFLSEFSECLAESLGQEPIPVEQWRSALEQVAMLGLSGAEIFGFVPLHPLFLLILRESYNAPNAQGAALAALRRALFDHYAGYSHGMRSLLSATEQTERRAAVHLVDCEYDNLLDAAEFGTASRQDILPIAAVFEAHADEKQDTLGGLSVAKELLAWLEAIRPEERDRTTTIGILGLLDYVGRRLRRMRQYQEAIEHFERAVRLLESSPHLEGLDRVQLRAALHVNLGMNHGHLAHYQAAEAHYREALIGAEAAADLHTIAATHINLSLLLREQERLDEAERHCQEALPAARSAANSKQLAELYLELATVFFKKQEYEKALAAVTAGMAYAGTPFLQADFQHTAGVVLHKQGRLKEAKRHLTEALKVRLAVGDLYKQATAYSDLGSIAADAKEWEEARECFTQALRLFNRLGDYNRVTTTLGNLTALKRLSGGLDVASSISSVLGIGPGVSAELVHDIDHSSEEDRFGSFNRLAKFMTDASAAFREGRIQESVDLLTAALELDPDMVDAYFNRSVARQFLGDYRGVVADSSEIIRRQPNDGRAYFNRGNARRELGDSDGALEDLNRAITLEPDQFDYYCNRGLLRWSRGDTSGAMEDLNRAVRLCEHDWRSLFNRGRLHLELGDSARALSDFDCVLEQGIRESWLYDKRAKARMDLGQLSEALHEYNDALHLRPDDPSLYSNRSLVHLALKDFRSAVEDCQHSLELDSAGGSAWYNLACALSLWGKIDDVFEPLATALRLDPALVELACQDTDLDPVRSDPRFSMLLTRARPEQAEGT